MEYMDISIWIDMDRNYMNNFRNNKEEIRTKLLYLYVQFYSHTIFYTYYKLCKLMLSSNH